jgi:hypothetical protein
LAGRYERMLARFCELPNPVKAGLSPSYAVLRAAAALQFETRRPIDLLEADACSGEQNAELCGQVNELLMSTERLRLSTVRAMIKASVPSVPLEILRDDLRHCGGINERDFQMLLREAYEKPRLRQPAGQLAYA